MTTVICARFTDSTLAYQGYGAGVDLDLLRRLTDAATDGLRPDLTIILDVPVEVGLARKAPGDVTRFEAEYDLAFHHRVRDGFLAIAGSRAATGSQSSMRPGTSTTVSDEIARPRRSAHSLRGEPSAPHVRNQADERVVRPAPAPRGDRH